jgi:hypothetical protein
LIAQIVQVITPCLHHFLAIREKARSGFGTLIVHTGPRAWEAARHDPRACVVLPPGEAPEGFDWSLARLATPPVLIMDGGEDHALLDRLARAILSDARGRVLILAEGIKPWPRYVAEEVAHAA